MKVPAPIADHWTAISLTFEIFWIVVFLLAAAGPEAAPVTQFVYANF